MGVQSSDPTRLTLTKGHFVSQILAKKSFPCLAMASQRVRVMTLYRTLLHLGKEYPQGYTYFRDRCHGAFLRNKDLPPKQAEEWIAKGDYIVRELEALYMLKKYRTLKRRYYTEEN